MEDSEYPRHLSRQCLIAHIGLGRESDGTITVVQVRDRLIKSSAMVLKARRSPSILQMDCKGNVGHYLDGMGLRDDQVVVTGRVEYCLGDLQLDIEHTVICRP